MLRSCLLGVKHNKASLSRCRDEKFLPVEARVPRDVAQGFEVFAERGRRRAALDAHVALQGLDEVVQVEEVLELAAHDTWRNRSL